MQKEITASLGYKDLATFSRVFRKATGLAPGAYRERFRFSVYSTTQVVADRLRRGKLPDLRRIFPERVICGDHSAMGHKRTSRGVNRMSALPPNADMVQHGCGVRFVPKGDIGGEIKTSQIHRIHPDMPAATMMGIGLMWDFQKRIVQAAVTT